MSDTKSNISAPPPQTNSAKPSVNSPTTNSPSTNSPLNKPSNTPINANTPQDNFDKIFFKNKACFASIIEIILLIVILAVAGAYMVYLYRRKNI